MGDRLQPGQKVVLRDTGIFLLKLWIDGLKDVTLTFASVIATLIDVTMGPRKSGYLFYRVMRWGERFDLWLNLYGVADEAASNREGLFGTSKAGDDTFLGELEDLTGGERGTQRRL
jgi:hypothetical protein